MYVVSAAWRLARYNVGKTSDAVRSFAGLPTTMSGGALASFALLVHRRGWEAGSVSLIFLAAVMSLLMISSIAYPNLRGIRKIFIERKILVASLWGTLLAVTFLLRADGAALGGFLTGLFMVYVLFFPLLKKNFV
jgi:phosphatidylserine synthase